MANISQALGALAAVAAGVYSDSGYNGFGGLGKSPRRKRKANKRSYLKNLPLLEQEGAKADLKTLQAQLKTANEQAWADFYNKYPGAIPLESRKIDAVVARFLTGRTDVTTTPFVSSEYSSGDPGRGMVLRVQGREIAARKAPYSRFVTVCPGKFGAGKVDRAAANSILRMLQAGIRAVDRKGKYESSGQVFLAPTGGTGRIVSPESCMLVEVNARVRNAAVDYDRSNVGPASMLSVRGGGGTFVPAAASSRGDELEAFYAGQRSSRAASEAALREQVRRGNYEAQLEDYYSSLRNP